VTKRNPCRKIRSGKKKKKKENGYDPKPNMKLRGRKHVRHLTRLTEGKLLRIFVRASLGGNEKETRVTVTRPKC